VAQNKNNGRKPRRKKNKGKPIILAFLFLFFLSGATGFGILTYLVKDAPPLDTNKLKSSETSIIYDQDGKEIAKIHGAEDREHIKIDDVPQVVKDAFLAIEDVRFYDHSGVDPKAIARAAVANVTEGYGSQGSSTLTQQLVKLYFLSPEKTLKRKVQEAYLSLQLEKKFSKNEIFEMYLNRIFFGHNAYGIKAAARTYFDKDVKDLTIAEAATIAGLPKAPNTYSPFKNPETAKKRRNAVINNMFKYGFITAEQAEEAKADDFSTLQKGSTANKISYPYQYFVEYVQEELEKKYGPDKVFKGGLRVYTTLDPKIQQAAEKALSNPKNFPKSKVDENGIPQPQAAAVVIESKTGYIKAIVGGRGQETDKKRILNRATQSYRQPGSAFKPIMAYAPAIEKGKGAASVVDDAPFKVGSYSPKNFDGKYGGLTTLREGLRRSVNIVAIKLLKENKISYAHEIAKKMGISSLSPKQDDGLGIALGGISKGVTPLEMASAYQTFANGGIHIEPTAILEVRDRDDNLIDEFKQTKTVALKASTAYIMTDMLKTAVNSGTGSRAKIKGWPVAGKTGTTDESKDVWFVGFTPELTGAVWLGHDQPTPMPKQFGGTYPAQIWREIMTAAHKGLKPREFKKAKGIAYATVCKYSGNKPSPDCPDDHLVTDVFPAGKVPSKVCDIHVVKEICATTGQLPNEYCPDVVTKVLIKKEASGVTIPGIYEPKEKCTIHGPDTPKTTFICTDPSHGGTPYLANLPGQGEQGGCPDEVVQPLPSGTPAPTERCPLPDHTVTPKAEQPENPSQPGDTGATETRDPIQPTQPALPEQPEQPRKPGKTRGQWYWGY